MEYKKVVVNVVYIESRFGLAKELFSTSIVVTAQPGSRTLLVERIPNYDIQRSIFNLHIPG